MARASDKFLAIYVPACAAHINDAKEIARYPVSDVSYVRVYVSVLAIARIDIRTQKTIYHIH